MCRHGFLYALALLDRRPSTGVRHLFFHAIPPVQATQFSELLDALLVRGPIISVEEASSRKATESARCCFTISFDDGFRDTLHIAGPILQQKKIPAVVFVATDFIGLKGSALEKFSTERLHWPEIREPMSGEDVRACAAMGIEVASHGVSHISLAAMSFDRARRELLDSKSILEELTGTRVRYFAWPFGTIRDFPAALIPVAREAGYETIFSGVRRGTSGLPGGIEPRRELNLDWGKRICLYLAERG